MKAVKLSAIVLMFMLALSMQAQFSMSIQVGVPPPWGPAGYGSVHYYYLPDVEAYYDVQSSMFVYFNGSTWIRKRDLPSRYRNYDLYHGYKVVMPDYHGRSPYIHFKEHKLKYQKGYRGQMQRTIGEGPGRGNQGGNNSRNGNMNNQGGDHNKGKKGHGRGEGHGNGKNK
ncbi:MAG: hypothetical protein ACOYNC_04435 [Bacteroidales bacterium]